MGEYFSSEHRFKVSLASNEILMSHWIDTPYLIRVSDNATLFKLDHLWSASDSKWLNTSTVSMELGLYSGLLSCAVTLDIEQDRGEVSGQTGSFIGTLSEVQYWLNHVKNPSKLYRY